MKIFVIALVAFIASSCQDKTPHHYSIDSVESFSQLMAESASIPNTRPSQEYMNQPIKAFDTHQHPGSFDELGPLGRKFVLSTIKSEWVPKGLKTFLLKQVSKLTLNPYGIGIGIQKECLRARLSHCGLFAVHSPETWGVTSNQKIIAALEDKRNFNFEDGKPYFYGFATIDMNAWRENPDLAANNLRADLSHPHMVAVKLAFVHNNIPLSSEEYDGVYRVAAEFQKPVYHHIGSSPLRGLSSFDSKSEQERYLKSYNPNELEKAISTFKDTQFILGHMGFDFAGDGHTFIKDCYRLAKKYPNVYLEMSSFGRRSHDANGDLLKKVLGEVKSEGLIEKLIYGSDGPTYPGATKSYIDKTLTALEQNAYTHQEAESVLYYNFINLINLP